MTETKIVRIGDYTLDAARHYSSDSHMWVALDGGELPATRARIGFDPLGSETSGDIVAVSFEPVGSKVKAGEAFGQIEAAKFVGPLLAPVSGTIASHNADVLAHPPAINDRPLDAWLIEVDSTGLEAELSELVHGADALTGWFREELKKFTAKGMIAQ